MKSFRFSTSLSCGEMEFRTGRGGWKALPGSGSSLQGAACRANSLAALTAGRDGFGGTIVQTGIGKSPSNPTGPLRPTMIVSSDVFQADSINSSHLLPISGCGLLSKSGGEMQPGHDFQAQGRNMQHGAGFAQKKVPCRVSHYGTCCAASASCA